MMGKNRNLKLSGPAAPKRVQAVPKVQRFVGGSDEDRITSHIPYVTRLCFDKTIWPRRPNRTTDDDEEMELVFSDEE